MAPHRPPDDSFSPTAATLSLLVPGLGQLYRHRRRQALQVFIVIAGLLAGTVLLGRAQDRAAEIFAFMLIVLPVWVVQGYDAYLPSHQAGPGLLGTLKVSWQRGHDVRYLGGLFLLSAFMDAYIILANPSYALSVFCTKPEGLLGILAKAQSPTLHTLIGYGFLRLRRWSLLIYLAYAGFGLTNAVVNTACFGVGRIRTVLIVTLVIFTAYILWRRDAFRLGPSAPPPMHDLPSSVGRQPAQKT